MSLKWYARDKQTFYGPEEEINTIYPDAKPIPDRPTNEYMWDGSKWIIDKTLVAEKMRPTEIEKLEACWSFIKKQCYDQALGFNANLTTPKVKECMEKEMKAEDILNG